MSRFFLSILSILFLGFIFSSTVFAAELDIRSDEAAYKIGDLVKLRIAIEGKGFSLGEVDKEALKPFEYAGKEELFSEESGKTTLTIKGYVFEVGEFTLPPFEVKDSEGKSYNSTEAKVVVKALLKGDEKGIKPLKGQLEIDEGGPLWPWLLAALLIIAIIAAIWFLRRMKKEIKPEQAEVEVIPPRVEALKALDRIEGLNLLREGRLKEYYSLIGDVIRKFEGRINGFDAMEMTTEELVNGLEIMGSNNVSSIRKILTDCDMVKFAKYTPPDMDISALMARAREIIDKDSPQESVGEEMSQSEERVDIDAP